MRGYPIVWATCVLGLHLIACRKTPPPPPLEEEAPVETEPPELGERGTAECRSVPGRAFAMVRTSGRIETGPAVAVGRGFAVSALMRDSASEARIFVRTDVTRDGSLGAIHGGGDPPQLASDGSTIFAAWIDQDAGGAMMVLAALANEPAGLRIRARKEIETKARPTDGFEMRVQDRNVAVVWDSFGVARGGPSGLYCALFDAVTLEQRGPQKRLSSLGEDASRPRLIATSGGYWLVWATALSSAAGPAASVGLVDAPPEKLRVRLLGNDCTPRSEPLDVTMPEENLFFDAAAQGESLWIVSKGDRSSAFELRTVTASGVITQKGPLSDLGQDLPRLLSDAHAAWVLGRAPDGAALLGSLEIEGTPTLQPEPSLLGLEILGVTSDGLIVERREGGDADGSVSIDVISCATGAARPK